MPEPWQTLLHYLLAVAPFAAWVVWWLLAVNWRKLWPVLASGAWAPAVLLLLVAAGVWSRLAPSDWGGLGFVVVPNFLWQLGAVALLAATALFCGFLQGRFRYAPPEIRIDPPEAPADGHGHAHH